MRPGPARSGCCTRAELTIAGVKAVWLKKERQLTGLEIAGSIALTSDKASDVAFEWLSSTPRRVKYGAYWTGMQMGRHVVEVEHSRETDRYWIWDTGR